MLHNEQEDINDNNRNLVRKLILFYTIFAILVVVFDKDSVLYDFIVIASVITGTMIIFYNMKTPLAILLYRLDGGKINFGIREYFSNKYKLLGFVFLIISEVFATFVYPEYFRNIYYVFTVIMIVFIPLKSGADFYSFKYQQKKQRKKEEESKDKH